MDVSLVDEKDLQILFLKKVPWITDRSSDLFFFFKNCTLIIISFINSSVTVIAERVKVCRLE